MTTLIKAVYAAFKTAGVPDDEATAAAEAIAGYENRFATVETALRVHTWILSFNTAMLIGRVLKTFA